MNERIKELINQAYVEVPHERDWDAISQVFDKAKFAELIVRECAMVAVQRQTEDDIDNVVSKNPARDFAAALIKHFGI